MRGLTRDEFSYLCAAASPLETTDMSLDALAMRHQLEARGLVALGYVSRGIDWMIATPRGHLALRIYRAIHGGISC